ncbi:hypothetical protein CLV84_0326 [Neolewinella xylanilytica]|uniref:Uncharacterized protein n=1 Tax=Neolewinella xylanilytica TaxID=1514080 RepID=A0A2S6I792_9BACT|nr:hypothetical protein [Neolewinella xylanilytica]PPK87386.1 hypothetical protein CLV84_0326 [Neolewinella xylanilytica]
MVTSTLAAYREDLIVRTKTGIEFMLAATLVWFGIALIWLTPYAAYDKSVLTFMVGAVMLPLALLLSKVMGTTWKLPDNPLQPLGLWLNFAQLFYFPILVFLLLRSPEYFIMGYAIITGAHLFPYAWLYDELGYAVAAGVISLGALGIALFQPPTSVYLIPLFTAGCFLLLSGWMLTRRTWARGVGAH